MTARSTATAHPAAPNPRLRPLPALALALVAALSGAACTVEIEAESVDTETRSLEQSFPIAAGETVRLANLAGTMLVEPGPAGEVRVEATIHAAGRNPAETQELLDGMEWIRHEDGWALSYPVREHSKFHYPREGTFGWADRNTSKYLGRRVTVVGGKSGSIPTLYADLRVIVPAEGAVELRNVVGPIDGGDLAGDLTLDTGTGDVKVTSFSGDLTVDTGSGDVEIGRAEGTVNVDTGSGDVHLGEVNGERVLVDTGSGDVEVGPGRLRSITVDTGSGEITLRDVDAETIEADTGSGDVVIESPLDWARRVVVDTGSGDVEIYGDPRATFRITADQGSGELDVRYDDVRWLRDGREITGAERGDLHTTIEVDTGSGDCVLAPR